MAKLNLAATVRDGRPHVSIKVKLDDTDSPGEELYFVYTPEELYKLLNDFVECFKFAVELSEENAGIHTDCAGSA